MHPEALKAVQTAVRGLHLRHASAVLDVGGRDVNGTPRGLFAPSTIYLVLDIEPGPNVDIVADVRTWEPPKEEAYDVVLSTEVFEHLEDWPVALMTMGRALRPGGTMIVTAAMDPRPPHSGLDGWDLRDGEFYENVDPNLLGFAMARVGVADPVVWTHPRGDVYAYGQKVIG